MSSVYIETTIPSFYYEVRQEPEMIARRNWTRQWWDSAATHYDLFTSVAVIEELSKGDYPSKTETLQLVRTLPLLPLEPPVRDIAKAYIVHEIMPRDVAGDALHLAIASYNRCSFLLTWNCQHLANANKFQPIRRVNTLLNLPTPDIVTPVELLGAGG